MKGNEKTLPTNLDRGIRREVEILFSNGIKTFESAAEKALVELEAKKQAAARTLNKYNKENKMNTQVPLKEPQVEVAVKTATDVAEGLFNKISELKDRLKPVLKVIPQEGDEGSDRVALSTPLAEDIFQVGDRDRASRAIVDDILDRLEI